jgi:WD40 repeat protein
MSRIAAHVGSVTHLLTLPPEATAEAAGDVAAKSVLVSGGADGQVRLWALPSGQEIRTLGPMQVRSPIGALAVSGDGRFIAAGGRNGRVELWDPKTWLSRLQDEDEGGGGVTSLTFLDGGAAMAIARRDGTIRLVGCPTGRELALLGRKGAGEVNALAAVLQARLLAGGGEDGAVRLWQVPSGEPAGTLNTHTSPVRQLAVSGDGSLLATAAGDGQVALRALPDGLLIQQLLAGSGSPNVLLFSRGRGVLAAGGGDGAVRVWVTEALRLSRLPVPKMTVTDLAWIQRALSGNRLAPDERGVFEFAAALIARRHRHDVIVTDVPTVPHRMAVGEFDIEIANA